jgi:hypothetical protein
MLACELWLPTPENINALPDGVREYIHYLETLCDPGGLAQENILLKDSMRMMEARMDQQMKCKRCNGSGLITVPILDEPYQMPWDAESPPFLAESFKTKEILCPDCHGDPVEPPHHGSAGTKDICLTCDRGPCPYAANPFAIAAARRRGLCPFNPPASAIKKAVFEDPLKASRKKAKGMAKANPISQALRRKK